MTADRLADARARAGGDPRPPSAPTRASTRATARAWWLGDAVAPRAVVLLHGLSNGPLQYARLAPQLHARGHAVIVPRLPHHGYRDRMTDALAELRAGEMEEAALRAVALAALCGERVVVAGISIGAALGGWLAARVALDVAVAVAPFCGIRDAAGPAQRRRWARCCARRPTRFSWWDPRAKQGQPPEHGYPRFATRSIGASLRLSTDLDAAPRRARTRAASRWCSTATTRSSTTPTRGAASARLRARGVDGRRDRRGDDVPHSHDLIEPEIPQARHRARLPAA